MKRILKMILEIIIVPLAICYLLYLLCNYNKDMIYIVFIVFSALAAIEIIIKGIKYLFKKDKKILYKLFALFMVVVAIAFLFSLYWYSYVVSDLDLSLLLVISLAIMLLYMIIRSIVCIIHIVKNSGMLYTNVTTAFMYIMTVSVVAMSFTLYYFRVFIA